MTVSTRHTVASLRAARGRHIFALLRVETLEEAEAAERAGVELLSVPPAMVIDRRFREVAPEAFVFPGDNFFEIGDTTDFLRWAFPLTKHGADAVCCSGSLKTVRPSATPTSGGSSRRSRRSAWRRCGPSRRRCTRGRTPRPSTLVNAQGEVVARFREWLATQG